MFQKLAFKLYWFSTIMSLVCGYNRISIDMTNYMKETLIHGFGSLRVLRRF